MKREPFQHHIELIFQALEVGLDGIEQQHTVETTGVPDNIDPDKFNRCLITIDGRQYCVSIFRPAGAPVDSIETPVPGSDGMMEFRLPIEEAVAVLSLIDATIPSLPPEEVGLKHEFQNSREAIFNGIPEDLRSAIPSETPQ